MRRLALCVLLTALSATPALADTARPLSVQASAGFNTILPTYEWQVGYRLPVWEERIEAFVSHAPPSSSLSAATFSITQLGVRTYITPSGPLQPFVVVSAGVQNNSYTGLGPALMAGGGLDWMLTSGIGLTASLTLGLPSFLRPMVGLRAAF